MAVAYNPSTVTTNLIWCTDTANPKSYSTNVIPYPLDIYTWCKTAGVNNCTISQDTTINRSPVGGIPLKMVPSSTDPYIATYANSAWSLAPASSGQTWTLSVWIKASVTTNAQVFLFPANSSHSYLTAPNTVFSVTTFWQRFTFSTTFSDATTAYVQCRLDGPDTGFGTDGVTRPDIWFDGLQLEPLPYASSFNPVANLSLASLKNIVDSTTPGTLGSNPSYVPGNKGRLTLDGSANTVETTIPITSTPALSNFTYEIWASITSFPAPLSPNVYNRTYRCGVLLGATYYCGAALYWYGNTAGDACTMYGFIRGSDAYRTTAGFNMALNTVYHFVMVHDYTANKLRLYVNGSLFSEVTGATAEYNSSLSPSAGNIGIAKAQVDGGGEANYSLWNGSVYSARIYKTALTSAQVLQNYNALRNRYYYYEPTVVRNGLEVWIDAGNYSSGLTVNDLSVNGRNGRLVSNPTYNTSPARFEFDGASQYIQAPSVYTSASQTKTVECWVYITLNTKGPFVGFGGTTSGWNIGISAGGQFDDTYATAGSTLMLYLTYTANINLGAATAGWNHLVVTQSSGTYTFYRNGSLVNSYANSVGNDPTGSNCWVSYMPLGSIPYPQFYGSNPVAVARYYSRVLALSEVQQNYNAERERFSGGIVYSTPGTYTFTVPALVTSISIICVGGGGSSSKGNGGPDVLGNPGGASSFGGTVVVAGGGGAGGPTVGGAGGTGSGTGTAGGSGGSGGYTGNANGGGGGAGGYTGAGGNGSATLGTAGSAGLGGGGGGGSSWSDSNGDGGGGGGGVGIYGQGSNGAAGGTTLATGFGRGGSNGDNGVTGTSAFPWNGSNGGAYGGGGGANQYSSTGGGGGGALRYLNSYSVTPGQTFSVVVGAGGSAGGLGGDGANGAVRIIWGINRSFPSTNVNPVNETRV